MLFYASIVHSNDQYYGKELSDEIVTRAISLGIAIKERIVYEPNEEVKFEKKLEQVLYFQLFSSFPAGKYLFKYKKRQLNNAF